MLRKIRDTTWNYDPRPGMVWARFDGRELHLLAVLLAVVSCTAGIVLYHFDRHAFLYFGDAVSHLVRSRQFFDSQRPGFHNIGTVWLPLPHLILLPLVAIDPLFYSGIAGMLVGIPCLVGTCLLLFLIVRRITGSPRIALVSGTLFGLNPNLVYMALTPMTEPILIFLVAVGGYALLRWLLNDGEYWLWACAGAVALSSLCRYEAWFLVPVVSVASGLTGIVLWRRAERKAALRFFTLAGICWAGIVFWVSWNYAVYGDPLKFAHWTYSVAPGAPARGNVRQPPLEALLLFGRALLVIFGPVVLLTALVGCVRPPGAPLRRIHSMLLLLFFSLPAVFALAAILSGFVQLDRWQWNWRYVLTAGLFLAVAAGIGLAEVWRRFPSPFARGAMIAGLFSMTLIQMAIPSVGVATFHDARRSLSDKTRFAVDLGEQLRGISREGSIILLTGYADAQRIMISSGLPLKQFHIIYDPGEQNILGSLLHSSRYVIIGKERTPESEQFVHDWLSRRDELLGYYAISFEDDHHILLERKPGSTSP